MYYYVKENPTELYHERHQLLVGQAKGVRLASKALKKKARSNWTSRAVRGALSLVVAALLVAALTLVGSSSPAHAETTFTVNSTSDFRDANLDDSVNLCDIAVERPGAQCTLRAAIEEANHTVGADAITFNIREEVDPGVKTIQPTSALPSIEDQVTIDGYTQPGASPNTLAKGTNALPMIELNGQSAGAFARALNVQAANTVVRGLVINRFSQAGILVGRSTGVRIEGNFIGTDPTGTIALGNSDGGVDLSGSSNSTVGGATPEARNLISGNSVHGVRMQTDARANKVQGNLIGTQKDGKSPLGNSFSGVGISFSSSNIVGGASAAEANTISFNGADGVAVLFEDTIGNRILRNSIFSNADGIDLAPDNLAEGPTPNDLGDADKGANGLQNKPTIRSAVTSGGKTTIKGKLSTKPNNTFMVRFFSNPSGEDEGKTFIGQKKVTTNLDGKASFTFLPAKAVSVGKTVTATATGSEGTSEFSAPRTITVS